MRVVADLEGNGFLQDITKIHCLCLIDIDTEEVYEYADIDGYNSIDAGLLHLSNCSQVVFHFGEKYDLPVIEKLYPNWKRPPRTLDSFILARLMFPDRMALDRPLVARGELPSRLMGNHSLESYGYRLGVLKGDYGKGDASVWDHWTPEMHSYMIQDCWVLLALYRYLQAHKKLTTAMAVEVEHDASRVCALIEQSGFPIDLELTEKTYQELMIKSVAIEQELQATLGTIFVKKGSLIPKRDNPKKGYVAGCQFTKVLPEPVNPKARAQLIRVLKARYKWQPVEYTDKGTPKLDDEIIKTTPLDPAIKDKLLAYLTIEKVIGFFHGQKGKGGWLNIAKDGRIHTSYNVQGAVTMRATHSDWNITLVPRNTSPYGEECRSCFVAPKGRVLVDADLKGLELRMLAEELYDFDNGVYASAVVSGDPHQLTMAATGLERDPAKTFIC